jgi:FdhD protein
MPRSSSTVGGGPGYSRLRVRACRDGRLQAVDDCVAEEVPVALVYNGESHVVMMATPQDLEDFGLGFSLSEDVIAKADELEALEVFELPDASASGGYELRMRIPEARHAALTSRRRNLVGRTGCGLCGAEDLAGAIRSPRRVGAGLVVEAEAIRRALAALRRHQPINAATGATHAAGWATAEGEVVLAREDVGRHNALDKLIGALVRERLEPARGFAVVTSRASYEMALKAAMAGIPLLAAISAPTVHAIRVAEEAGLTLIGYGRGDSFVVYACPARVLETRAAAPA